MMMTDEEHKAIELKNSYSQYRNLFEQKLAEHYMYRMDSLIEQLREELILAKAVKDLHDYDPFTMQRVYNDVLETLPAMSEFSEDLKQLTVSIYKCWTDIRRVRLRQSAIFTPVNLIVKKVQSNLINDEGKIFSLCYGL